MSFAVAAFNYHHPVALHPVMASAPWTIYHAVVRRFPSQQFESVSLSLCDVKREFEGTGTDVWRGWTPRSHCLCICVYDCILGETVSAVMDSPPGRTITTPLSSWRRQMRMMETTTTTAGWLAPANKTKKKKNLIWNLVKTFCSNKAALGNHLDIIFPFWNSFLVWPPSYMIDLLFLGGDVCARRVSDARHQSEFCELFQTKDERESDGQRLGPLLCHSLLAAVIRCARSRTNQKDNDTHPFLFCPGGIHRLFILCTCLF